MPETLESTPTEQSSQDTTFVASTQDNNRQALYERHYGTPDGGTAAPVETAPPTDSVAQAEQVEAPVTPAAATLPPEVLQLMQSMQQELAAVKERLTPTAATPAVDPNAEPNWVTLLREGKTNEAVRALAGDVAAINQTALIAQATAQTRETMRAEAEIDRYTTEIRGQNPDLAPMEQLIAADAGNRMAAARTAGIINSTDDAVRIYKSCVAEAVTSARKLYHTLRGDGKQEAQVRQREVLSSRPIPPQSVDTSRPQVTGTDAAEAPQETVADYLEKRRSVDNWRKGLAPKPNFI